MWNSAVITNAGKSLLAEWVTGRCLNLDSAAAGEGTVQDVYLMAQTALVAQKQTLSVLKAERIEGGIRLQLQCTNQTITDEYKINQIGVWASLDEGESTLVAIFQDETGVSVPAYDDMPDYVFTFWAVLQVSNEGEFTANIDTSALVTHEDLAAVDDKIQVLVYVDEDGYFSWKMRE
ncbi:MAG TPA: hypothetical protein IAC67_03705 [Candidatus Coproplasma excrementipullorum]|nr:hypothetical protein [Candidatus Coproplasma excrementipullorum]